MTSRTMAASGRIPRMLFALACLTLVLPCARAWSNGGYSSNQDNPDYGTHDWIADMALTLQTRDVTFLRVTYHSEFLLGTEAPDNPEYIGDSEKHHVYFYATHQLQDDACAARASQIYQIALAYLLAGDYHSAAYDIGVLTHYVSDPGVFGHTMGAYTDWGAEVHHSDYEDAVESMIGSLSPPEGVPLGDSSAYIATLGLGENITFGQGAIRSNVWMDANYDWADASFAASAMASLYASVAAVASVINHLMVEAAASPPSPSLEIPQPPVSVTASVEGSHVVLTWSPPPNDEAAPITGYRIYRGTAPDSPSYVTSVPGDVHRWMDEYVKEGTTYYYWVVAENSMGASEMSRAASATVPKDSDSSALPLAVSAISIALASGGVLLWRRRARGRSLT